MINQFSFFSEENKQLKNNDTKNLSKNYTEIVQNDIWQLKTEDKCFRASCNYHTLVPNNRMYFTRTYDSVQIASNGQISCNSFKNRNASEILSPHSRRRG